MLLKKLPTVFILLIAFTSSLVAQEIFNFPVNDETRRQLHQIFNQLSSHDLIHAQYSQITTIAKLNRKLLSSGIFIFHREKGLAWLVNKPFHLDIIITQNEIIQRSSIAPEQIIKLKDNPIFYKFSRTVQTIFLGDLEEVEREYHLYYSQDENTWTLAMVPKDSGIRSVVSHFQLDGDVAIRNFLISETLGNQILYQFDNVKFPSNLEEEEIRVFRERGQ